MRKSVRTYAYLCVCMYVCICLCAYAPLPSFVCCVDLLPTNDVPVYVTGF